MTQTPRQPSQMGKDRTEGAQLGVLSLEISGALAREETLGAMLEACTKALVKHLDAAFARIWTLNEAENVLELQASAGMYTHLDGEHGRVPVGKYKIGLIAEEREPHLTNHVREDPRVSNQEWARREGMIAFAGYPLLVGERLIGVIGLFARHPLDAATIQTMEIIANGLAVGIERLQIQEERNRLLEKEQTARLEAERERERMRMLFMQAPALICVLRGPEHILEFANPGYLKVVGERALLGRPIREALPEIAGQGIYELLEQVYRTGEAYIGKEVAVSLTAGESEEGYFDFVYQPTRDARGEVEGILVHAVEVTEQVQAREAIRANQQRLRMAQRVGKIGTFEWNIQTNEIYWTPELEALYGLPAGGFEGKYESWRQRVNPEDIEAVEKNLQEAIAGGAGYNIEFRVTWPDGTNHWVLGKGEITRYDQQERPLHMLGVNIDITERKEGEEQLAAMYQSVQELNVSLEAKVEQRTEILGHLNTELQRSNQELQEFAYVASHDLQEPLRKIQAFGNLLEEEYGDVLEDGKSYLDRMRNAAGRMRILIEDLLTFSRVTTKGVPFAPVDLNLVVNEVIDDLEPRLEASGGKIEAGRLPTIDADGRQMYQMFQNLLSNALKFHEPGVAPLVKIEAEVQERMEGESASSAGEQVCLLSIQDNGIGFDEKYLDRIFTVFQRLHGKGNYEGTGIGLAVVRKIVERHDGSISAKSSPGEGATFLVTLPMVQKRIREVEL